MESVIRQARQRQGMAGVSRLIPYSSVIGVTCEEDAEGLLTRLPPRHSNIGNTHIPAVHGGVVGALLEHASLLQLIYLNEHLTVPRIINLSIDYLRPVVATRETFARCVIIKQGRKVANVRATAWQEDDSRPVAASHGHFLIG